MRISAAVRHLQHIASLGLDGHVAIPEMLGTLGAVVPGLFNSFVWLDARGGLRDVYAPHYIASAFDAFVYAYDRLPASEPTFDKVVAQGLEAGGMQRLHARHDFSRSILCTEVWRPYGVGCPLDLVLRDGATPLAMLCVNREPQRSRFTAQEYRALRSLAPHFQHALSAPTEKAAPADDTEERSGVVVADAAGAILSASGEALPLMLNLTGLPFGPAMRDEALAARLPEPLAALVQRHARLRRGEGGAPAVLERASRWGTFRARAYSQSPRDDDDGSIVIVLTHHLPRTVRLARQLAALDLSPRERQVAFHIGLGDDADTGITKLGVTVSTWRSYVKRIYQRLDVNSRGEFHALLLGTARGKRINAWH